MIVLAPASSSSNAGQERIFASPMARMLAADKGINLASVSLRGSGFEGSITAQDVEKLSVPAAQTAQTVSGAVPPAQPVAGQKFVDLPVTNIRGVIAKRLLQSKQTIPHYYLSVRTNICFCRPYSQKFKTSFCIDVKVDVTMDSIMQMRQEFNAMLGKDGGKLSVNDFIIKAAALACRKVPEVNSSWQDTFIRQ